MLKIEYALLFIGVVILIAVFFYSSKSSEPFVSDPTAYKSESAYTSQVALVNQKYSATATSKRPIRDLLAQNIMPESQQNFVNFYALACRFTGYIGPMKNGYLDPDVAVQMAVNAGCRVFVLDIDYLDDCTGAAAPYFPQLVVRDAQGKLIVRYTSNLPMCNDSTHSMLHTVCEKINF
jgi:hypothetical protein